MCSSDLTTETRTDSPHKKEIPMTPVSHGKPCAGNPHARFEEGASAQEEPRRSALLNEESRKVYGWLARDGNAAEGCLSMWTGGVWRLPNSGNLV